MKSERWWPTVAVVGVLACGVLGQGTVTAQVRSGKVMGPPGPGHRPDGAGSVRGRVVDGATGQPLRGATISVTWRATQGVGDAQFLARTDAYGVFAVDRLPDGTYFINVHRQGFHEASGSHLTQRQATLRGGETLDMGDVRLLRGGVLTGRVVDDYGEPVVGARVTPVGKLPGQDVLIARGILTTTDDRGVYRAHGLTPGKYTVRVVPPGPSGRGPVRLQGNEPELLPAFATSATDPAAAEFVVVRASADAMLDVRLSAGRLSRVAGQVVVEGERATSAGANVSLHPGDGGTQMQLASARIQPDGQFEFLDVAPGQYRVVAEEPMVVAAKGPMRRRAGWVEIAVTGEPVIDVVVPIGFGAVVRGRVEIDDGDPADLAGRPLQVMAPVLLGSNPVPSASMISSSVTDLAFELRDVLGRRQLQVMGLPPGWWLKSVLIDGEDAFDGLVFPVSGVLDDVVLIVSARPSGVGGRVQGSGGQLQGASVLVLPVASMDAPRPTPTNHRIASVSADGAFTASALRPGRYTLMALSPRMRSVYDGLDREARQALVDTHGRQVDVVEGRLAAVTLRLVER